MSTDNHISMLSKGAPPVPKSAIAAIVILMASVVVMVVYMRSKPNSTQEAVAGQELVIGVDRATLYVPKDAVILAGVISISSLESNLYSVAGEESDWFRSQVVDIKYLNREGAPYSRVTFPKPVLICFMIKERWQDYTQHPDEYLVQYYAAEQNPPAWVSLPMSDNPDRYQVCGQTKHLSIFALAVKPKPQVEIPITGATLTLAPTSTETISPTPTGTPKKISSPASSNNNDEVATPVSTQAALTATSVALTATDVPPTATDFPVPDTDTPVPDTLVPDTDTPVPDTPVPDTSVPDTPIPDTPVPDTPIPDTPVPDTPVPDPPVAP